MLPVNDFWMPLMDGGAKAEGRYLPVVRVADKVIWTARTQEHVV